MQFRTLEELTLALAGYANIVTYLAETGLDIHDDDDVMDACVEVAMDNEHFTDEELRSGLIEFREMQAVVRGA